MDARAFDRSKLPSRNVTKGGSRAPRSSHANAMGSADEQTHRLLVGVVSSRSPAVPCNFARMRPAPSARRDVDGASGTPRKFCTTRTDGIAADHLRGKAKDVHGIDGVPQITRALSDSDHRNADGFPVTAKRVGEHLENVKSNRDQKVVCRVAHPISRRGEVVGLQGSGAPEGATGKVMDMTRLRFREAARVFDGAEDFKQRRGMAATAAVDGRSADGKVAPIADRRLCAGGFWFGDLPITRIGASDVIASDAEMGALDPEENEAEPATRRNAWTASANPYQTGTLRTCADQIGRARTGAVAHAGSRAEVACYADF